MENINEKIEAVLNEHVRPLLATHGGNLEVTGFDAEEGVLRFKLLGNCAGCSAADLTSEELINAELTERVPEVKKAVMVTDVNPDLLAQAKELLRQRIDHA